MGLSHETIEVIETMIEHDKRCIAIATENGRWNVPRMVKQLRKNIYRIQLWTVLRQEEL